ncbi:hypothetical protein KAFR_0J02580 [Kazachstania africana CBS 2517]|uniref:Uncharacterized protein n=1 Tax=Kazachstania africana (strain ATCC 22294 / BCRC 22015 / CBS 2517 / CECT 1963 / NBRC 1671 / NRRL Y-8276) TaxID=1071382 RepID=H2B122_KAZAF|nr:hypothetical protein KAFR_0J02580 [Kazachstania africana CBS 2517]CCF60322.1 hypothetical protein KAFR_0J02580 [Kazachstania africana CBS 2517]
MLVPPASFGIAEEGIYRCSKVETLNLSFLETLNLKTVIYIGGQEPSKFFKQFFNRFSIEWFLIRTADFSNAGAPVNSSTSQDRGNEENALNINDEMVKSDVRTPPDAHSATDRTDEKHISKTGSEVRTKKHLSYSLTDNDEQMLIKSSCLKKAFRKLLNSDSYNTLLVDKTGLIIGILRKIQKWHISSILNEYRLYAGKNQSYYSETFLELIQIRIEQDIEDTDDNMLYNRNALENLKLAGNTEVLEQRTNNTVDITEEDLMKSPEVPQRLISIMKRVEAFDQQNPLSEDSGIVSKELARSTSNLGIFGNRYRFAFTKRENGDYDYYKPQKSENAVTLKLPKESKLPEWFKFQRDLWEQENVPEEHHFYKEHIFV